MVDYIHLYQTQPANGALNYDSVRLGDDSQGMYLFVPGKWEPFQVAEVRSNLASFVKLINEQPVPSLYVLYMDKTWETWFITEFKAQLQARLLNSALQGERDRKETARAIWHRNNKPVSAVVNFTNTEHLSYDNNGEIQAMCNENEPVFFEFSFAQFLSRPPLVYSYLFPGQRVFIEQNSTSAGEIALTFQLSLFGRQKLLDDNLGLSTPCQTDTLNPLMDNKLLEYGYPERTTLQDRLLRYSNNDGLKCSPDFKTDLLSYFASMDGVRIEDLPPKRVGQELVMDLVKLTAGNHWRALLIFLMRQTATTPINRDISSFAIAQAAQNDVWNDSDAARIICSPFIADALQNAMRDETAQTNPGKNFHFLESLSAAYAYNNRGSRSVDKVKNFKQKLNEIQGGVLDLVELDRAL